MPYVPVLHSEIFAFIRTNHLIRFLASAPMNRAILCKRNGALYPWARSLRALVKHIWKSVDPCTRRRLWSQLASFGKHASDAVEQNGPMTPDSGGEQTETEGEEDE